MNILCLNRHTVVQIMKSHCISITCTLHNRNFTNFILMFTFCSCNCGQMHTVGKTQFSKTICVQIGFIWLSVGVLPWKKLEVSTSIKIIIGGFNLFI